ncbi:MAG: transposase [Deltaproteobacteria bacterium]|nr:transposase [Deltaproteobacteria bacterium]
MEIVFRNCCGLDIQKETVIACALIQAGGKVRKEVRTFRLSTTDLLLLHDWLAEIGVTHVAMEGTAIHWKPVYHFLEGSSTVILTHMKPMKSVPGRRAGVEDCEWMADVLSYGLLKDDFILPAPIRDLRDLFWYRKSLGEERMHEVNRLDKILESVNLPVPPGVFRDAAGFSKKAVLEALLAKTVPEEVLAELAKGEMRDKLPLLREALQRSPFPGHQRFMLEQVLIHSDFLNEAYGQVSQEVQNRLAPLLEEVEPLKRAGEVEPRAPELDKRLLVICANCKKIRDAQDSWTSIETYLREHFATQFSHTVCPDCGKMLYPDIPEDGEEESDSPPPSNEKSRRVDNRPAGGTG